ncbi:hypothetical protein O1611_g1657 [Lasiodiplodia mahajangana]|uniref:Uncharacterized protein n=1 Tax=Lasiodiplodia mahajangana TaxID=1108764 RepID=A0ACC2JWS3_9PEZI|nr:hypothetical protein O1611_g1657 [Lasiodiplodia mahajangana]
MPPVIDVVCHAQARHDTAEDSWIRDPGLTDEGEREAFTLGRSYAHMDRVSHIISSPLQRTIRTCIVAFEPVLLAAKKVILLGELQETGVRPCDTGYPPETLEMDFRPQIDTSSA